MVLCKTSIYDGLQCIKGFSLDYLASITKIYYLSYVHIDIVYSHDQTVAIYESSKGEVLMENQVSLLHYLN